MAEVRDIAGLARIGLRASRREVAEAMGEFVVYWLLDAAPLPNPQVVPMLTWISPPLGKLARIALTVALAAPLVLTPQAKGAEHETGRVKSKKLKEISGLAASRKNPHVLWMHNDGKSKQIFGVVATGKLAATIDCPVSIEDIEDIAIGPGPDSETDYLYLGDIGDNELRRAEIQIVRIAEPDLSSPGEDRVDADQVEVFQLRYPDGRHNAEALLVDPLSGDLFVVTKEKGRARIYQAAASQLQSGSQVTLEHTGDVPCTEVSGGDIAPDGSWIVLRREEIGWIWPRAEGMTVAQALARPPKMVPVRGARQAANGESVGASPSSDSYFTVSEGKKQPICQFELPSGVLPVQ